MPRIDPVLKSEVHAYIREDQKTTKAKQWEQWLPAARSYIRDPKNRDAVLKETRFLIAQAIRADRLDADDVAMLYARDRDLQAYVTNNTQVRDLGPGAVHVDTLMTNMSVRFSNPDYIGEQIAPAFSVDKESNLFAYYDERANLAFPTNKAGSRGELAEVNQNINVTDHNYKCEPLGLIGKVTPREMANADVPLDPLVDELLLVMEGNAWNREVADAAFYVSSSNYASANVTAISAGEEYDSVGGGDPNKQIQTKVNSVFRARGAVKKIMVMSIETFTVLSRHPAVRDLFKYTTAGFATRQMLAAYYNVDELLVGEAWKDSANSGQTASYTRIWNDSIAIVCQNPGGGVRSYSHSKRFRKGAIQNETLFIPQDGFRGVYHIRETYLETVASVAPKAGALLTNALSS